MAQAIATRDRYLSDFQAFQEGAAAGSPPWLRELRERAFSRFSELGFPTARRGNEPWKYTNVAPIAKTEFEYLSEVAPEVSIEELRRLAPWDDGWTALVFVDGRYAPALSAAAGDLGGARVASLAEAARSDARPLERHLARYASFESEAFTALNTAFLDDGAFIYLPDGVSLPAPLHLVFVSAGGAEPTVAYPRTLIVAGANASLTVVESYVSLSAGRRFTNAVTEIVLGEGARVSHHKLLLESTESYHVGVSRVYQERDSTFSSLSFAGGAALGRNDLLVLLDAPGSASYLHGLYVTTGSQHIDNYINIDHRKPHTTSRLYYRGILDGKSHAVFGGTVFVRPGADKADAHQEDKNLLLSADAEVDSKPSLEIYADDVKCGHGATAGTVADDAIFYMKSRGLDLETASSLLIKGFAAGILDTIELPPLRSHLEKVVGQRLSGIRFGQS